MANEPNSTHGSPSWLQHSSKDPAAAREFYETVLGWTVSDGSCLPMDQIGTFRPLQGEGAASGHCDMGAVEYIDRLFAHGFEPLPGLQP